MALDLSRFAKAFFEEAQEHISALESLLVAVNLRSPDPEALNAIFRAVHSVKGGAAAFGHMALSEFTHDFESILDRVRKGKLTLTKPMVNTFLKAGDVMRRHLLALEQDKVPDVAEMSALRESLIDLTAAELEPPPLVEEPESAAPPRFRIEIHLEKSQYEAGDALDELKTDIAGLGEVLDIATQSIDERLLAFVFQLNTDIDADELRESLEFIVPAEAISIVANERRGSVPARAPESAKAAVASDFGFFDDDADGGFGFFDGPAAETAPARPAYVPNQQPAAEPDVQLSSLVDASSIRVNVAKVDQLINLVGELVIAEAMVSQAATGLDQS
ncbi:MAG: Hpt domain-containing protein, partial [Betaproteobacteria bacterium]|nr:Hpt domain-containing protein [Betaproteobacteria bacterium]